MSAQPEDPASQEEPRAVPDAAPRPRRSALRRWGRRALLGGLFGTLLLALLYLTREAFLHPLLVRLAPGIAQRVAGYELELEALHGDWLHGLDLEGLSLRATDEVEPLRELRASRLGVNWDLFGLLGGDFGALHAASGRVELLELDLTRGESTGAAPGPWPRIPARLPAVELELSSAELRLDRATTLTLRDARVTGGVEPGPWILDVLLGRATLDDGQRPLALGLSLTGTWDDGLLGDLALDVDGQPLVREGTLDLRDLPREALALDLPLVGPMAHGALRAGLQDDGLRAHLVLEGLDLAGALQRTQDLLPELELPAELDDLAGRAQLDATLELPLARPETARLVLDLEAGAVDVATLRVDDLQLHAELEGNQVRLHGLRVDAGDNHLRSADVRLDLDALDPVELLRTARGRFELRGTELGRFVPRPTGAPESPPPHRYDLVVELRDGDLVVERGRLELAGGTVELNTGRLRLEDDGDGLPRAVADLRGHLDLPELAPLGELLALGPLRGSLSGTLAAHGDLAVLDAWEGEAQLTGSAVELPGLVLGEVAFEGRLAGSRLEVQRATFVAPHADGHLTGAVDLSAQRLEDLVFQVDVRDPETWSAVLRPGGVVHLRGELDGPLLRPDGSLDALAEGLALEDLPLEDLSLHAVASDGVVSVERFDLRTPHGAAQGRLRVDLPVDDRPLVLHLESLGLRSPAGAHLDLVLPRSVELGPGAIAVEDVLLRGERGELEIDGSWDGERASGTIALRGLEPTPFAAHVLPPGLDLGRVDGELRGTYGPEGVDLVARGDVRGLVDDRTPGPLDLRWDARLQGGRLELAQLVVRPAGDDAEDPRRPAFVDLRGSLPLDPVGAVLLPDGELRLAGRVELPEDLVLALPSLDPAAQLDGGALLELDLRGTWRAPEGSARLRADGLRLALGTAPQGLVPERVRVEARVDLGTEGLTLASLDVDAPERLTAHLSGSLGLPLDATLWLAGTPELGDAPIVLRGDLEAPDLAFLASLDRQVRRVGGSLSGRLDLGGTLGQPTGEARMDLLGGSLKVGASPQLDDLELHARFVDGVLELQELRTNVGAAPLVVRGTLSDLGGSREFDLVFEGENVLLVRDAKVRLRADFDGVRLSGPLDALHLAGKVRLRNSRLTQNVDFLGALQGSSSLSSEQRGIVVAPFPEGPLANLSFDLEVESAEPVGIVSNVARGEVLVTMRVRGSGRTLLPQGTIFVERTKVLLPGGRLDLTGGTLQFDKADPFVPQLDLYGETRMLGYDVTAHVTGPYDQPVVDLASSPPLSRDALLVLLLSGQLPSSSDSTKTAETISIYLAKDLLTQWFDDGLESDGPSLLDRFEYESGREISDGGVATFEAKVRVAEAIWIDQDKLYLVAEQDRYEDYNAGVRISITLR